MPHIYPCQTPHRVVCERFRGRYRIPSARWRSWDYGQAGAYFVTIVCKKRRPYFGNIVDGQVRLSEMGRAAWSCWRAIPEHFPNASIDAFVAMPDHVHGIVVIDRHESPDTGPNRFGRQSRNLASIVRGFKIGVTMHARRNGLEFAWQPRYHDRVIRDDDAFERIRRYIENNPRNAKRRR